MVSSEIWPVSGEEEGEEDRGRSISYEMQGESESRDTRICKRERVPRHKDMQERVPRDTEDKQERVCLGTGETM